MKNRGFTLAEIMVTLGIIALLCAFAIPNFLRARCNSTETLALTSCQTIGKACQNFYAQINPHTYPDNLADLGGSTPSYIDAVLAGGQKQGYNFLYTLLDAEHFQLQAQPITPGSTGNRFFFQDETGVLRVRMGAPAGPGDVPVE